MSGLKQQIERLHAQIIDLFIEWHKEHPNDPYLHRLHSKIQNILDGYVCIPKNKLEELKRKQPKNLIPDYHSDCKVIFQKVFDWFKDLDKLLEESK